MTRTAITFRTTPDVLDHIRDLAERQGTSANAALQRIVEDHMRTSTDQDGMAERFARNRSRIGDDEYRRMKDRLRTLREDGPAAETGNPFA